MRRLDRIATLRTLVTALVVLGSARAGAQFSGYSSLGYGFHQNPLYNYAKLSDQLTLGYLELAYQNETDNRLAEVRYVGGLTSFNQLSSWTYYEHSIAGLYVMHFTDAVAETDTAEEESEEQTAAEETDQPASYADSTVSYLSLGIRLAARHNRIARLDFDNRGIELKATYRIAIGNQSFARVVNSSTYRTYPYVAQLSNWNNVLSAEIAAWTKEGFVYGLGASAGVKYYTTTTFDTTLFQRTTTTSPGGGKGKGGGNQTGTMTEEILLQPQINGTLQLSAGLFFRKEWSPQSSLSGSALYRVTPRYAERYLAPLSPEAGLTEDLYSDFFSSKGPELRVQLALPLPARISSTVTSQFQYNRFGIPALDLDGYEIEPARTDLRSSFEVTLSRSFEVFQGLSFDGAFSLEFVRNQSNDLYNDFSVHAISFSIGIGF